MSIREFLILFLYVLIGAVVSVIGVSILYKVLLELGVLVDYD